MKERELEQSGESEEKEVMAEGLGEQEMEKLAPETKGADSRHKVKHNERGDQLFLDRMKVAKRARVYHG